MEFFPRWCISFLYNILPHASFEEWGNALSCFNWQDFHLLAPEAQPLPTVVPSELLAELTSPPENSSAIPSCFKACPPLRVGLMLQPKLSLSRFALNLASSTPLVLHVWLTNGHCTCLLPSWPIGFSILPLRSTCLGFEHFILNRGFQTPLLIVSAFRGWFVVSSAVKAPPLLPACRLQMTWCFWFGSPWIFVSRITSCSG